MAKKTRREKEVARLRREVEALRAQVGGQNTPSDQTQPEEETPTKKIEKPFPKTLEKAGIQRVNPKFTKADLKKTAVLSLFALAIIFVLYLLRARIPFF